MRNRYLPTPTGAEVLLEPPSEEYVLRRLAWIKERMENGWRRGVHPSQLQVLYYRQGGRCIYCQEYMWIFRRRRKRHVRVMDKPYLATKEHLTPRAKGGKDDEDNLACACQKCNVDMGDLPYWRKQLMAFGANA